MFGGRGLCCKLRRAASSVKTLLALFLLHLSVTMAVSKFLCALVLLLAITGPTMAYTTADLLAVATACGPTVTAKLQVDAPKCQTALKKAKKTCPSACKSLISGLKSGGAACQAAAAKVASPSDNAKTEKVSASGAEFARLWTSWDAESHWKLGPTS